MTDDDLIRRGAALKEVDMWESDWVSTDCAIRALPAVTQPAPDSADRIEALTEQLAAARRDAEEAEAYAEELEATLAKAVEAMQEAIKLADMPHYGDREDALDNCFDAIDLLRTTLSELNGDKP